MASELAAADDRAISWPWVLAGLALVMIPGLFGMTIWRVAQTPGVGPLISQPSPTATLLADGTSPATPRSGLPTAFPIFGSPSAAVTEVLPTATPAGSGPAGTTPPSASPSVGATTPVAIAGSTPSIGPTARPPEAAPTLGPSAASADGYVPWPGRVADEEGAYLRGSPDSRAPVRAKPNYGTQLVVMREVQGTAPSAGASTIWYEVRVLPSGEVGFIHSSLVGLDPSAGGKREDDGGKGGS